MRKSHRHEKSKYFTETQFVPTSNLPHKKINVSIEDFFINKNHNFVDENKERKKQTFYFFFIFVK